MTISIFKEKRRGKDVNFTRIDINVSDLIFQTTSDSRWLNNESIINDNEDNSSVRDNEDNSIEYIWYRLWDIIVCNYL